MPSQAPEWKLAHKANKCIVTLNTIKEERSRVYFCVIPVQINVED